MTELECDVLIVGAGTGGCAAALAACSLGLDVIMTRSTPWTGGQLTAQMVPPDEHPWIEEFGCTARYREFRNLVRKSYRNQISDATRADAFTNPGGGWVSRLCFKPIRGNTALVYMDAKGRDGEGKRNGWYCEPIAVTVNGDSIESVTLRDRVEGQDYEVRAKFVLDATELGDLLPLAGAEYRVGSESISEYSEPHATEKAEPDNVQGFTWCFALANDPSGTGMIEQPADYNKWRTYQPPGWPGPMLSFTFPDPITGKPRELPLFGKSQDDRFTLFTYRQIVDASVDILSRHPTSITCVNWPQNDYFLGSVIDVPNEVRDARLAESKALGRSLLYWLQNDAPRHDGGVGYPQLKLSPQTSFTPDGFAQMPYHRESRRMVTRFTVTEQMVAADCNPGLDRAPVMSKSVGVGHYRIDLHPSANGRGYIDIPSLPFQIPLGALIPVRLRNLLPACKNLGVTHITNGCYRLHPVEWNIGEAAGLLAAFCVTRGTEPAAVYENEELWLDFERLMVSQGIETAWPNVSLVLPG